MGLGGISIWQLLIILVIIMLLFGTKKLRNIGSDLGNAIKSFRGAMREGEKEDEQASKPQTQQVHSEIGQNKPIEGQIKQPIEGGVVRETKNAWDTHSNAEKKV